MRELDRFYERVDQAVRTILALNPALFQCRPGCHDCCIDGLSVFEVEARNIACRCRDLLLHGAPHPEGACVFLGSGGDCRIYEHRPYVCRTQGLPLRWVEEQPDGMVVEMRDICPLNDTGKPLENLKPGECWSIGPFEEELAGMQLRHHQEARDRVLLRTLFANKKTF